MGEESSSAIRIVAPEPGSAEGTILAERIGALALGRHRARPRTQQGFTLLGLADDGARGHALLAHQRRGLGATTIDVAVLELAADTPELTEALLEGAVMAASAAELPFLAAVGRPSALGPYGLAPCALVSRARLPRQLASAPMLRQVTADDAEDVAALADVATAGLPLGARRAPPDWRWLLAAPAGWVGLEDGRGRLVAYARLAGEAVVEAGAADAGAARTLVAGLAARSAEALALPALHPVTRAALLLGGALEVRALAGEEAGELWGVVDLVQALTALTPELTSRMAASRYKGWSGSVRLEGPAGAATLRSDGARVSVHDGAGPVDVMVGGLGLAAAAQLLLGYRAPADLRATGELRCADVDLGLLDALLPTL
jgi:hypothetical protein